MSLRHLIDADCGGQNPLMQLGGQFTRDIAHKDEGFSRQAEFERGLRPEEQLVNEFFGQMAAPPQSFQMDTLLKEMQAIEQATGGAASLEHQQSLSTAMPNQWTKEFAMLSQQPSPQNWLHAKPQQQQTTYVREFFDDPNPVGRSLLSGPRFGGPMSMPLMPMSMSFQNQAPNVTTEQFFAGQQEPIQNAMEDLPQALQNESAENWIDDFQTNREKHEEDAQNYNEKFWERLQDEWQKMSEDSEHPWLSEFNENFDPYKQYEFAEENPMSEMDNALEKGKEYLARGDIPSAVLCFEVAAKKDPENAEIWELLGMSQAENEMDPQSIAALKRSLELKPDNPNAIMALAVCYTNESLQSHALKMLTNWLQIHPKYKHLVEKPSDIPSEINSAFTSSLIRGGRLQEVQDLYLEAVRLNPTEIDADIQEALGVLYNLSSEYDRAVDCFKAALQVKPQNAKLWNRLGASLANGSRSVEAVEAYQQALQLEPGFIRVRYNVGVCCMNLKAYKQAVEHLLTALNMQANSSAQNEFPEGAHGLIGNSQQRMSESIWSTLRMIVSLMGRNDLQGHVTDRNLAALNEAFKE